MTATSFKKVKIGIATKQYKQQPIFCQNQIKYFGAQFYKISELKVHFGHLKKWSSKWAEKDAIKQKLLCFHENGRKRILVSKSLNIYFWLPNTYFKFIIVYV